MKPVVLLDVVGLTPAMLGANTPNLSRLAADGFAAPMSTVLPAVTCSAQATMVTGRRKASNTSFISSLVVHFPAVWR